MLDESEQGSLVLGRSDGLVVVLVFKAQYMEVFRNLPSIPPPKAQNKSCGIDDFVKA